MGTLELAERLGRVAARDAHAKTPSCPPSYPSVGAFVALQAELKQHGATIERDILRAFGEAYRGELHALIGVGR